MDLLEFGFHKSMFLFMSKTQVLEMSSNHWKLLFKKTLKMYGECLSASVLTSLPTRKLKNFRSET